MDERIEIPEMQLPDEMSDEEQVSSPVLLRMFERLGVPNIREGEIRTLSAEPLRLHALQEGSLQIRSYANAPNYQDSLAAATRNLFPASGNEVNSGDSASASTISVRRPARITSRAQEISNTTSTQSEFDPETFDPTDLSFRETCKILSKCDLDKYTKLVRDTILRYSLSLSGFSDCADKDLMIAVYFYFEEKFNIEAKFELCVRFESPVQKDAVGVVLDSIRTTEEILEKAATFKKRYRIMRNGYFHWIMDGFLAL